MASSGYLNQIELQTGRQYHLRSEYQKGISNFSTNNVLIHKRQAKQYDIYFPGYFMVNFQNFLEINLNNLNSVINTNLDFRIYYGDFFEYDPIFDETSQYLNRQKQEQTYKQQCIDILKNKLKLNLSRDQTILLSQSYYNKTDQQINIEHLYQQKSIQYKLRKQLHIHLDGNLKWSPFQIIHSILQITVQPILFKIKNINYVIKINLMNIQNDLQLNFLDNTKFGNYGLATSLAKSIYSNFRIQKAIQFQMTLPERGIYLKNKYPNAFDFTKKNKNQTKTNILWFQYAIFNIPMYKFPLPSLVTVFIPLWLLGLINLGIYFQDQTLSDRIASIIGLMIAFIAFIPTIQSEIPPSSHVVLMQILVYAQSLGTLFTFIHSIRVKNISNFKLIWASTPQYLITLILLILSTLTVSILMILHYTIWQPKYLQLKKSKKSELSQMDKLDQQATEFIMVIFGAFNYPNERKQKNNKIKQEFNRFDWNNVLCDIYFNGYFEYKKQLADRKKKNHQAQEQDNTNIYKQYFILEYHIQNKQIGLAVLDMFSTKIHDQNQTSSHLLNSQ